MMNKLFSIGFSEMKAINIGGYNFTPNKITLNEDGMIKIKMFPDDFLKIEDVMGSLQSFDVVLPLKVVNGADLNLIIKVREALVCGSTSLAFSLSRTFFSIEPKENELIKQLESLLDKNNHEIKGELNMQNTIEKLKSEVAQYLSSNLKVNDNCNITESVSVYADTKHLINDEMTFSKLVSKVVDSFKAKTNGELPANFELIVEDKGSNENQLDIVFHIN